LKDPKTHERDFRIVHLDVGRQGARLRGVSRPSFPSIRISRAQIVQKICPWEKLGRLDGT
jgi:hypothetical protein